MTTLPDLDTARRWRNLPLVTTDGAQVGLIEGIYVDRETGRPEWALVEFDVDDGARRAFVPLTGAGEAEGSVRVTCERERITGAPLLPAAGSLSLMEETRLYDHYGIAYSTAASPSVLPAAEAHPSDLDHPMADDELDSVGSTLDARPDAPESVQTAFATAPLVADEQVEPVEVPPARPRGRLAGRALALAGLATAGALAARRRSRGSGSGVRAEVTKQMNRSKRKAARAGRRAEQAPAELAEAGTRVARAAAKTAEAAAKQVAKTAEETGRRAAKRAERTRRKAAKTAKDTGRRAAQAAEDAGRRVADAGGAVSGAAGAAARTAGDAAGTVAGLPAATTAAARERLREAAPKRRRRSKRKRTVFGRLGLALGAAVGYVLGTRDGRERYDQMVTAAKQLGERPEVKRIVEQAPGAIDATVGTVAEKAADKLGEARERVLPERPAPAPEEGAGPKA
jgi:hypothetical protein